jgi:vacuolar-type H+-ATPase subunit E/Vma4
MKEDIKGLIEKINQEGIKRAEEKARQIEAEAMRRAEEIVSGAKIEAERIVLDARSEIARLDQKERTLLAQAGRDFLLSLRKEIDNMLGRLVSSDVAHLLTPEALTKIISDIAQCQAHRKDEVVITLNKDDLKALEKGFIAKLKTAVKKGIILKESADIRSGFTISFDAGRSCFDFTDKALADFIVGNLKPKLAQILDNALPNKQ